MRRYCAPPCPRGGTGRRDGLKIRFPQGSVGSIPTGGTSPGTFRRCRYVRPDRVFRPASDEASSHGPNAAAAPVVCPHDGRRDPARPAVACLGACLCVGATAALCALLFGVDVRLPIIVVPAPLRAGFQGADVDAALARLGETFDIDRAELDRLLSEV
jgi:hypothetical protein